MANRVPVPVDAATFNSLQDDLVLPAQFFTGRDRRQTAEMQLLWRVFIDGIEAFCNEIDAGRTTSELWGETIRWIEEDRGDSIFAFRNLCEIFEMDPDELRRKLTAWMDSRRAGVRAA